MRHFIFALLFVTSPLFSALESPSIRYNDGKLSILDQQLLPGTVEWVEVQSPEHMVEIIKALKVRGAPLIGVSAALALAQHAESGASTTELKEKAELLRAARPTAVNLAACIDRVLVSLQQSPEALIEEAKAIFLEDVAMCQKMGENGAELIHDGEVILTYCNTGALATAGIGTAFGVLKTAHDQGKNIHVYACETRPLLQGGRLTAWELEQNGIPYTLICDNMAASLMKSGKINRVFLGADRIANNGDFANKIGTYSVAVLAKFHNVPFHVVAPYTTIDHFCPNGDAIEIEQRSSREVQGAHGSFGSVIWTPKDAPVYNPAFDVTPHELVTSYVTDKGNLSAEEIAEIKK
ncbi:MAG: S-methyl-5-thioribose-1-phosphate isomerase [Verrucomicrobia bacterium]|nr:S-methyl-5-thioribose-1-phosphate isomerase [Verrucomicrobiota bacterium]